MEIIMTTQRYEFSLIISGRHSRHFTVSEKLFERTEVRFWKFEVIYTHDSNNSTSAMHFEINNPPRGGKCLYLLMSDTMSFECLDWQDEHDIYDYRFYGNISIIIRP